MSHEKMLFEKGPCRGCIETWMLVGRDGCVFASPALVPKHDADCAYRVPHEMMGMKVWSYDPALDKPRAAPSTTPPPQAKEPRT